VSKRDSDRRAAGADKPVRSRLVLVMPDTGDIGVLADDLRLALSGGDVAAVLIGRAGSEAERQAAAERLVPVAQGAGAAAVVIGDTRAAGRSKADGLHLDLGAGDDDTDLPAADDEDAADADEDEDGDDEKAPSRADPVAAEIAEMVSRFKGKIVGVGGIRTRHAAMAAAEAEAAYVLFGLLERPDADETHRKTLTFADWWVPLFEVPCIALAGSTRDAVAEAASTGAEFIGVRTFVWSHPEGPAAGVAEANTVLDEAFAARSAER
jgi:thiamine-phosphate pyrophosphorylase